MNLKDVLMSNKKFTYRTINSTNIFKTRRIIIQTLDFCKEDVEHFNGKLHQINDDGQDRLFTILSNKCKTSKFRTTTFILDYQIFTLF